MALLERRLPKNDSYFLRFAKDNTSQGGEDGILEELFRLLTVDDKPLSRYCVDIGAWDGKHLSNTFSLLNNDGWGGLLVEAENSRFEMLSALYENRSDIACVSSLVDLEGSRSLLQLLMDHNVPLDFGFLCIDVDGADYHLWNSIANQFHPVVVCIEFNPTIPNDVYFCQAPQIDIQQGSSLLAIFELATSLGYILVATTTFNAIFVRGDHRDCLPMSLLPQSIDLMHVPFMTTEMFQTYDGELKYVGMKKLLWHKISLNPQKLQLLPKKDRVYPFAPSSAFSVHMDRLAALRTDIHNRRDSILESTNLLLTLLDLMSSPSLETHVWEAFNQSLFALSMHWQSRSLITADCIGLLENLLARATAVMDNDNNLSQRLISTVSSLMSIWASTALAHASQRWKLLQCDLVLAKVRNLRLKGDWFAAWETLSQFENLDNSDESFVNRKRIECSKLKHLLKIE